MKLIELEEVDSTNDYLKREYQNLPMQTCVTAKYQTKGRGRNGHVWESHANENLIMSFLFKDFIFLIPEIYMTLQPDATFEAASYLWFPKQIILAE